MSGRPAWQPPPLSPRKAWLRWAAGTAAALLAGGLFTSGLVASRYEARLGQMARETAAVRERLQKSEAALREQLAVHRDAVELLRDPATRVVELRGQPAAPRASGRVLWHERAGGQVVVAGLPPAPPGTAYEVWAIAGGVPRPAGALQLDDRGRATQRLAPAPAGTAVSGFVISAEPAGGAAAPTGPAALASR